MRNAGLTDYVAQALHWFGTHGRVAAALGTGFLAALLSSMMNNMPAVLVGALAIHHASAATDPMVREIMVYANIIGCDLGPKFTPKRQSRHLVVAACVLGCKGVTITWGQYMKTGLLITPPVLLVTLPALAWWLPLA